jgi:NAD(P)H dehydrogenase (quinone)
VSIRPPRPNRIAVTGANGAIGSRVVERLRARSDVDIVPIVRDLSRAHPDDRVRPALAPYEDRAALTAALSGCDCLVLIGSDGEADRMLAHHANIIRAARRAEVSRTVLLSSLDADPGSPFCYAHTYATTEGWAREALPGVAVLRAGLYAEFIGRWLWEAARSGVLSLPMGTGRISPVARRDVADLLTELTLGLRDPNQQIELVGPESLDHADLAGLAGALGSRSVASDPCDAQTYRDRLARDEELNPWWAYAFQTLFASVRENRFDHPGRHGVVGRRTLHVTLGASYRATVIPGQHSADSPA